MAAPAPVVVDFPLRGEGWMAATTPAHRVPSHGTDMLGQRYAYDFVKVDGRPGVHVHKGTAALQLTHDLEGLGPGASLLFAGDDVTDEDAFRDLRANCQGAVTIRVAHDPETPTDAEFLVADHEGVRALLEWLADFRGAPTRRSATSS